MQEVTIRLRFNRECLGSAPRLSRNNNLIYKMHRDAQRRVMFLPSWWSTRFRFASRVLNRYDQLVSKIAWDSVIDGNVRTWRRTVVLAKDDPKKRERYALHEAFRPGATIGVNAVIPDGLTVDAFTELLVTVGTYKGISPFQDDEDIYGTFEVLSVMPTVRSTKRHEVQSERHDHVPCDS
jgi:hypothetical protein